MDVSGKSHDLAALSPVKTPGYALSGKLGGPQNFDFSEKS